jgi:hypothetical protein
MNLARAKPENALIGRPFQGVPRHPQHSSLTVSIKWQLFVQLNGFIFARDHARSDRRRLAEPRGWRNGRRIVAVEEKLGLSFASTFKDWNKIGIGECYGLACPDTRAGNTHSECGIRREAGRVTARRDGTKRPGTDNRPCETASLRLLSIQRQRAYGQYR